MIKLIKLLLLSLFIVDGSLVIAESVEIFEGNNLIYNISTKDMKVKSGHLSSGNAIVQRKPIATTGCIASTKSYKIGGKSRSLQFIPKLSLKWWGELGGPELSQINVVRIAVEHLEGTKIVSKKDVYIHTGHLTKKWIATLESGAQYYRASLNVDYADLKKHLIQGDGLMFGGINIKPNNRFRLSVCNISSSTKLSFRGFDVLARSKEG